MFFLQTGDFSILCRGKLAVNLKLNIPTGIHKVTSQEGMMIITNKQLNQFIAHLESHKPTTTNDLTVVA